MESFLLPFPSLDSLRATQAAFSSKFSHRQVALVSYYYITKYAIFLNYLLDTIGGSSGIQPLVRAVDANGNAVPDLNILFYFFIYNIIILFDVVYKLRLVCKAKACMTISILRIIN
jgi:hypothetical protein